MIPKDVKCSLSVHVNVENSFKKSHSIILLSIDSNTPKFIDYHFGFDSRHFVEGIRDRKVYEIQA